MISAGFLPVSLGQALVLLCRAVWAWFCRLGRREAAIEVSFEEEAEPRTRPSARRFHTWSDVARFVRSRYPEMSEELAGAFTECAVMDEDSPSFGSDWSTWIEQNHDRLLARAEGGES